MPLVLTAGETSDSAGRRICSWHVADLTDPGQVAALADGLDGPLDVLVNNAGGVASRGVDEIYLACVPEAWCRDRTTNALTAVLLTTTP